MIVKKSMNFKLGELFFYIISFVVKEVVDKVRRRVRRCDFKLDFEKYMIGYVLIFLWF